MPMDWKRPVDMKQVIARIADDSEFLEFGDARGERFFRTNVRPQRQEGFDFVTVSSDARILIAGFQHETNTFAPSRASSRAVTSPMPLVAPVTMTVLPCMD